MEPLIDVEDLVDVKRPDDKIVLTYVSMLFKGCADFLHNQVLCKAIKKALEITQRHDEWIASYEQLASEMVAWVAEKTAVYGNREHGLASAVIKEALNAFYAYKSGEKPDAKSKLTRLRGLLNTLQGSERQNQRPVYSPRDDISADALNGVWCELEAAEDAYEGDVRATYQRFVEYENTLARVAVKAAKCEEWMAAQSVVFGSGDAGSSLTQAETLLNAHAAYVEQNARNSEAIAAMRAWLSTPGIEQHADYGTAYARLEQLDERRAAMEAAGVSYTSALALSREKFDQLGIVSRVGAWVSGWRSAFSTEEYGATLEAVSTQMDVHAEFCEQRPRFVAMLEQATSAQDEVVAALSAVQAQVAELDAAAEYFMAQLEETKLMHEQMAVMSKVFNFAAQQLEVLQTTEFGDSLAATEALLASYTSFEVAFGKQRVVLAGVAAVHPVAVARHEEVVRAMDAVEAAGSSFAAGVHERKSAFEAEEERRALEITQQHDALIDSYVQLASDVVSTALGLRERFEAQDHGRCSSDVTASVDTILAFRNGEQVELVAKIEELRSVMDSLHASQRAHKRPAYYPLANISLEAVGEAWRGVEGARDQAEADARELLKNFVEYETIFSHVDEKATACEEWMSAKSSMFSAAVYGGSFAAVEELIAAHAAFEEENAQNAEIVALLLQLLSAEGIGRHSSAEAAIARFATIQASAASLQESAGAYARALALSREKFVQLGILDKAAAWCAAKRAFFEVEDYGATLEDVESRVDLHSEFLEHCPRYVGKLDKATSEQDEVRARLSEVQDLVAAMDAAAELYVAQLEATKMMIQQVAVLAKVANFIAHQRQSLSVADFGTSLGDVETLLAEHKAALVTIDEHERTLHGVTPVHPVAVARHADVAELMRKLRTAAAEHEAELLSRKAAFEQEAQRKADALTEQHREWTSSYEQLARESVEWAESASQRFVARDLGATSAAVHDAIDAFVQYKSSEKPESKAKVTKLHYLLNSLQSSQRQNRRPIFVPPTDVGLDRVNDAWRSLASVEDQYEPDARAEYKRFVDYEALIARIDAKAAHCETWMNSHSEYFAQGDFGTSLSDVDTLLETFKKFDELKAENNESVSGLRQLLATDGFERHSDFQRASSRIDALDASVAALQDGASHYHANLLESRQKFVHLGMLKKVSDWVTARCEVFDIENKDYSSTATDEQRSAHEQLLLVVPLIAKLSAYERFAVVGALREVSFAEGENAITEGEAGNTFYIIESGEFAVTKQGVDGEVSDRLTRGKFFGDRALIRGEVRVNIAVVCVC